MYEHVALGLIVGLTVAAILFGLLSEWIAAEKKATLFMDRCEEQRHRMEKSYNDLFNSHRETMEQLYRTQEAYDRLKAHITTSILESTKVIGIQIESDD